MRLAVCGHATSGDLITVVDGGGGTPCATQRSQIGHVPCCPDECTLLIKRGEAGADDFAPGIHRVSEGRGAAECADVVIWPCSQTKAWASPDPVKPLPRIWPRSL